MPNHTIALASIAIALAAHNCVLRKRAKRDAELCLQAVEIIDGQQRTIDASAAQLKYLAHMVDTSEITTDEFDLIALNYHNS